MNHGWSNSDAVLKSSTGQIPQTLGYAWNKSRKDEWYVKRC